MAKIIGNATDHHVGKVDLEYKNTLNKTVDKPSLHEHNSFLAWLTDTGIHCKAPIVHETYYTIMKIRAVEVFLFIAKILMSPINISLYGYSINMSGMYMNLSGLTTNTGKYFLLPSPVRVQAGIAQFKVQGINKSRADFLNDKTKDMKQLGGIFVYQPTKKKSQH